MSGPGTHTPITHASAAVHPAAAVHGGPRSTSIASLRASVPCTSNARASSACGPCASSGALIQYGLARTSPASAPSIHSSTRSTATSSVASILVTNPGCTRLPAVGALIATSGGVGTPGPNIASRCSYEFCVEPPQSHGRGTSSPHAASAAWNRLGSGPLRYVIGSALLSSCSRPNACAVSCAAIQHSRFAFGPTTSNVNDIAFGISVQVAGATPAALGMSLRSSAGRPPTTCSKCGTVPGSTSVTMMSNGAYVARMHDISASHTASLWRNAPINTEPCAICEMSARESSAGPCVM